ncbi:MAG: HEAT repeat domain-containing protein [Bacteroidales bacterium]|jgi:HEAT repeat protein|nr:HEAT repeat domain-containing protein [Bacteroidales bacterium]
MVVMIKYTQRIGFILLLFCLLDIRAAQPQEQPPSATVDTLMGESKPSSGNNWWWLMEVDDSRSGALAKTLVIVILLSLLCLVVLLIWILINRNKMQARQIESDRLMEQFESLLFDYLTSEHNEDLYGKIALIAKSDFTRGILINQMHELSKSMSMTMSIGANEEARVQLRELYNHMQLDQDSIRKIYSPKWHIQVKGFRELAFMDVTEANDKIRQALKSKNNILRMEAQLALVRLNENDPFGFLDHLTFPFTLWEQLNVYELIAIHDLPVPHFSRWTTSPNKTVVIFALRMIQVFKQQQAAPQIIECLAHPDKDVRHMAIVVCGEIQLRETLPHLKHMYKNEEYANCLAIVHAMAKMPDEMMLGFLKLVLDKEDNVQLQIESAKAISKMGEEGIAALVKLMKSEYKNYQIIIRHVLDKRIS